MKSVSKNVVLKYLKKLTSTVNYVNNMGGREIRKYYYKGNIFHQLKGFCAAVECESISGAASKLNLSHSAISLQIKSLENKINVYPNPSEGIFYLKSKNVTDEKILVSVYNSLGDIILKDEMYPLNGELNSRINLSGHSSGIYLMKTDFGSGSNTSRIILQK